MSAAARVLLAIMAGALAAPAMAAAVALLLAPPSDPAGADLVTIAAAPFAYRAAGDFSEGGRPVSAPRRDLRLAGDLTIMRRQVTAAEYARCVEDGGCPRVAATTADDRPAVGVSWRDAVAYAAWMTRTTGRLHRLPTDQEWVFAAAERADDEALPLIDPGDPAQAWIARYEAEANRSRPLVITPQPVGSFGANANGLLDVAGNVWEWTDTCFIRASLDQPGEPRVTTTNCGVRVVQGQHRTYMTDFIRDPRTGGCAAGVPPANLGFRLVVEATRPDSLRQMVERAATLLFGRG